MSGFDEMFSIFPWPKGHEERNGQCPDCGTRNLRPRISRHRIGDGLMDPQAACEYCGGSGICGSPPDRYYECPECTDESFQPYDVSDDRPYLHGDSKWI